MSRRSPLTTPSVGIVSERTAFRAGALATVLALALLVAGCGESSEEKATKQVCSATSEITAQLRKLEALAISSSFPAELKAGTESISSSVKKIKEAAPNLPAARKAEVEAANRTFGLEIAKITGAAVSAAKSSSSEAAIKSAEAEVKSSLSGLSASYKRAFQELKCS